MRKIQRVKRFVYRSTLKCRMCGKQETAYSFTKPMWPTHSLNGWLLLHNTEKCSSCVFIQMVRDGKIRSESTEKLLALGMNERQIRTSKYKII